MKSVFTKKNQSRKKNIYYIIVILTFASGFAFYNLDIIFQLFLLDSYDFQYLESITKKDKIIKNYTLEIEKLKYELNQSDSNDFQYLESITKKDKMIKKYILEIEKLKYELNQSDSRCKTISNKIGSVITNETNKKTVGYNSSYLIKTPTNNLHKYLESKFHSNCESRFGVRLIKEWRNNRQTWCTTTSGNVTYELICYPMHQAHKKINGRGEDLFCEANNIFLDFSKVFGNVPSHKSRGLEMYLNFQDGSIFSPCIKTSYFNQRLFMPHHQIQMRTFKSEMTIPSSYEVINHTTYLLARDEDCENTFHSTADFMNMMLVMYALRINSNQQQVVLFDNHDDGPYMDLIKAAYSPNYPILRHDNFKGKVIMFKRLIFHLESPAGLIDPSVALPDPLRCHSMSLFHEYRKFVLQSFNLFEMPAPNIPTITLITRKRTENKNHGRILANQDDVVKLLRSGTMIDVNVVDMNTISFYEQLKIVRNTNIIVGVHGAGLMHIMFSAEEAILIEIHPSYRQDRHFRHASRMTGKIYMPVRSTERETCFGTSDNVLAPILELKYALDGAVRIARSFDDGLAECGLVCPSKIIKIDKKHSASIEFNESESSYIDLSFPC